MSSAAAARGVRPAIIALCPARTLARTTGAIGPKCPASGVDENRIRIVEAYDSRGNPRQDSGALDYRGREAGHLDTPQLTLLGRDAVELQRSPCRGGGAVAEAVAPIPIDWPEA